MATVQGGPELIEALGRLSAAAAGEKLAIAARAGMLVTQNRWKQLFRASTDASVAGMPPRVRTGLYRSSIHTEVLVQERDRVVVAVGSGITDPPYPSYLEYGTSRMAPHPIARPAFEQTKEAVLRETAATLRVLLGLP